MKYGEYSMSSDTATEESTETPYPGMTPFELIRRQLGLRRSDIRARCGVGMKTLWRLETLREDLRYDTKRRLAKAVQKRVSEIWPEETDD